MARRTIRVEIPFCKPEELTKLGQDILVMTHETGGHNPLDPAKVAKLQAAVDLALNSNSQAKSLDAQAQVARQKRDTTLGIAKGQNASSPDTVLNLVSYVRDQLLLANENSEEVLGQYGFNIVISTAKSPSRNHAAAAATT
jgi:hypothetical protein